MIMKYPTSQGSLDNLISCGLQGTEHLIGSDLEVTHMGFGIGSFLSLHLSSVLIKVQPWASYITPPRLSLFISKMGIVVQST